MLPDVGAKWFWRTREGDVEGALEALLERVRLGPAGRLLQAREHVKKRREHVDQLAEQYKLYLLGQKLLGKKRGRHLGPKRRIRLPTNCASGISSNSRPGGGARVIGGGPSARKGIGGVNALATLVAELGGDASGVAAAASGLSDVFSQRKKAAPPPGCRRRPRASRARRPPCASRLMKRRHYHGRRRWLRRGGPPPNQCPRRRRRRRRPSVAEVADEPPASQESSARPTPRRNNLSQRRRPLSQALREGAPRPSAKIRARV